MRLTAAKLALAPVLLWQGSRVRASALRLPEAAGPREQPGGRLRVLLVGDSSAAGVGAPTQVQALAGQLEQALAARHRVPIGWQVVATSGHPAEQALTALRATPLQPADVLVTALGVNDVVEQVPPRRTVAALRALIDDARRRAGVRHVRVCAAPPMERFPLLPQPLRWFLGQRAAQLNAALAAEFGPELVALPARLQREAAALMADDGFHPNVDGYRLWAHTLAEALAEFTLDHLSPAETADKAASPAPPARSAGGGAWPRPSGRSPS